MQNEDIISFLEVSTGARVKTLKEQGEVYLFTLSDPKGELFPPKLAEILFIDFEAREAAFFETKENLNHEIELARNAER
jgi:hypothetical protein